MGGRGNHPLDPYEGLRPVTRALALPGVEKVIALASFQTISTMLDICCNMLVNCVLFINHHLYDIFYNKICAMFQMKKQKLFEFWNPSEGKYQ